MSAIVKGRSAERDIINRLQPILDVIWSRHDLIAPKLERRGLGFSGEDIKGLEWLSLEVKWRKQLSVGAWWRQTLEQCVRRNGGSVRPILFYRGNNMPWRVVVGVRGHCGEWVGANVTWEEFANWFEDQANEKYHEEFLLLQE